MEDSTFKECSSPMSLQRIGRDVSGMVLLAVAALCIGFIMNQIRKHPLPVFYRSKEERLRQMVDQMAHDPSHGLLVSGKNLTLKEFRDFVEKKQGITLDARPALFYQLAHVPGAYSLPREDFEASYGRLKSLLEKDKSQRLVVYCSGLSCEDSAIVRQTLLRLNFMNVAVFSGGWDEWTQAKLPQETK